MYIVINSSIFFSESILLSWKWVITSALLTSRFRSLALYSVSILTDNTETITKCLCSRILLNFLPVPLVLIKWIYSMSCPYAASLSGLQPWTWLSLLSTLWSVQFPEPNWSCGNGHPSLRRSHLTAACLCLLSATDKSDPHMGRRFM